MSELKTIRLSPSQIDLYDECPRKWGWRYLDKIRMPQHPAAALGEVCHDVLAEWQAKGKKIDLDATWTDPEGKVYHPGRIVLPALKHVPAPCSTHEIEKELLLKTEWCDYIGVVDLAYIRPDFLHVVTDYKSTAAWKWMENKDLSTDVQANIYAAHRMYMWEQDKVLLKWVYFRTKGKPASKTLELLTDRPQVEKAWAKIRRLSDEMIAHKRAGRKALDLKPVVESCENYGKDGCKYKKHCNISPKERLVSLMANSALQNKLAAKLAAKAAAGAPAAPAAAVGVNPPAVAPPAAVAAPVAPPAVDPLVLSADPAAAIMAAAAQAVAPPAAVAAPVAPPAAVAPPVAPPAAVAASVAPPAAEPPKRGRGRPRKTEAAPTGPELQAVGGFTLYVNCFPTKGAGVVLSWRDIVAPIAAAVAQQNQVADYRLVEFGKGPGMLSAALQAQLQATPLGGVSVCIDSRTPEGRDVLGVFEDAATVVVRCL